MTKCGFLVPLLYRLSSVNVSDVNIQINQTNIPLALIGFMLGLQITVEHKTQFFLEALSLVNN